MTDEIRVEGLGLKPGVLDRIVMLAATQVEGVASVCGQGLAGRVQKGAPAKGVEVSVGEDGRVSVDIHIEAEYGRPLRSIARALQEVIAEAIKSQIGAPIESVDVFIDGVAFAG